MKKREFLAMGGAVPLVLAGCGGNGSGSAPVRLVNASVGYPLGLGFMVESTQETTADVLYGAASPFINVQAGAVGITLTVSNKSATAAQVRTIAKDTRYSLVTYGFSNELRFALVTESTIVPDAGKANVNVLDTSADIGAVDVYLSATADLSNPTQIASNLVANSSSPSQTAFAGILAGTYFITVVGFDSVRQGISDVRFQSPTAVTLTALQVLTIILTPGASGVLANAILLTQGTASGAPVNLPNTTARIRAITSTGGKAAAVAGVLASTTSSQYSNYVVVTTGAPPAVTVNGAAVTPFMNVKDATTGVVTQQAATLLAGGDYTMMVYVDGSGNPIAQLIEDNNTAPVLTQGAKFRLVNLAYNNQGLQLSMSVNSISIASLIPYGTASDYTEISTPQTINSVAEVFDGTDLLTQHSQLMTLGNIFTDFVTSVDPTTGVAKDIFRAASGA